MKKKIAKKKIILIPPPPKKNHRVNMKTTCRAANCRLRATLQKAEQSSG